MNIHDYTDTVELFPNAVRTASANGSGVDIAQFVGKVKVILSSAAMSTGDTLDVKLQDSADGSTGWADISGGAFTQVTSAADLTQALGLEIGSIKKYIRAVATIAGDGGESVAFTVLLIGSKQVPTSS